MVFKGKKHIPLTNLADVRYRCDTCDVENKRTIKDRDMECTLRGGQV